MNGGAKVQSVEALKAFRVALCKFVEAARGSLGEAEADLQRHASWLSEDRQRHWKMEIRKREEKFREAKMALLERKLQTSATGGRVSCVDEEKALAVAQRRFEEAQAKSMATVRWIRRLEERIFEYKGLLQGLNHALDTDVVNGLARLDRMLESLEAYIALAPPSEALPPVNELSSAGRAVINPSAGSSEDPESTVVSPAGDDKPVDAISPDKQEEAP
jgi:hypothetical protein